MMKKLVCACLALILFLGVPVLAEERLERTEKYWRPLKMGDSGYDVMAMRNRLTELGYMSKLPRPYEFTDRVVTAVKKFQACNGMEQTSEFSWSDLEYLHSEAALPFFEMERTPKPETTPKPTATQSPTPEPAETPSPPMPPRDERGFLLEPGEYYKEDEENGEWLYLSESLQIIIKRYTETDPALIWFETHIFTKPEERFWAVENNPERPGTNFRYPGDIVKTYRLVLGFTDDFYGHRIASRETVGVVIRGGEIISAKTYTKDYKYLPNLDILAEYPDGTFKAYRCTEYSAEELLAMGVTNTYCFGPVLLQGGVIDERVLDKRYETRSPRQALGMIEPGHYFLLTAQGRIKESVGVGLLWMAEQMQKRQVTEALNLDGGNTVALVFRGKMLNRLATWKNERFVRTVSSMIGLGYMVY